MNTAQRISEIADGMRAIHDGWPFLVGEAERRLASLTASLIHTNNEETRGRIKALRDLLEWPEALQQELEGLVAALSDEDAA